MKVKKLIILIGLSSFYTSFYMTRVLANPVLNGVPQNASVQQSPGLTTINQTAQKAILNWQSFNIDKGETTHFNQPAGGVALNRINATNGVSQIYGNLTATGQIILINAAGIYFGPTSVVNVGGLIATTANMTDQNFLNGNYQFEDNSGLNGTVRNDGSIIVANNGLAALVAPHVVNNGLIQANLSTVVLGSVQAYTLDFGGDGLINFTINKGVEKSGHIENTGTILADGGKVLVTARAAAGVIDQSINMRGVIQAQSVYQKNGEIIFSGDSNVGTVTVAANMNASGKQDAQKGGTVKITGNKILIDSGTVIDVSGDNGGGDIFIGGNAQGKGPLPNSSAVVLASKTKLNADAINFGKGGNIVLWSDDLTKAYGELSARGGADGGNGGFIETSSHGTLEINNLRVNTSAAKGLMGTWLLDPWNITISNASTASGNFSSGVFTPSGTGSNVNTTDLTNNLASSNVTITTSGGGGAEAGNITIQDAITWLSANTLFLNADNNIIINAPISGVNGTLQLSAANAAQSITTGLNGSINVANFLLAQGQWYQVNATLPTFNVTNNFSLAASNVEFLRALGGNGVGTPYTLTDIYGVQGMGSSSTMLNSNFQLSNDIDATVTSNWTNANGTGFTPIGNFLTSPYNGSLDGQNFTISNLLIATNLIDAGLIGELEGSISNLGITGFVSSSNSTGSAGILVGVAGQFGGSPTVSNVHSAGTVDAFTAGGLIGTVTGGGVVNDVYSTANVHGAGGVGGLIGEFNTASLSRGYATGTVTNSNAFTSASSGGLVGHMVSATITDSYATGTVSGFTAGGLVGSMAGTSNIDRSFSTGQAIGLVNSGGFLGSYFAGSITNSFWNTETSGLLTSAGPGAIGKTTAEMQQIATYTGGGWTAGTDIDLSTSPSVTVTWKIIDGQSYPYLRFFNPTPPTIFQGSLSGAGSATSYNFVANGSVVSGMGSANNTYYFAIPASVLGINDIYIIYPSGSSVKSTFVAANNGGLNSALPDNNIVQIGDSTNTATIAVGDIITALGPLSTPDLLLSASGSTLNVGNATHPNVNLNTTTNTTLTLASNAINTNSSSTTGNFTFNGPVSVTGTSSINSGNGNQTYISGLLGSPTSLTINSNSFTLTNSALPNTTVVGNGSGTFSIDTMTPTSWTITGSNAGSLTSGLANISFSGFQDLIGGSLSDTFTLNPSVSFTGTITGGGGSNTIVGNNLATTWQINGANSGNSDHIGGFTQIANLTGGTNNDNFIFAVGGSLTGSVNGNLGTNSITNLNPGITWSVTGLSSSANGTLPGVITGGFNNISTFIGSGTDTLVGPNVANTWSISGANSGTLAGYGSFSGMANLMGGSNNDDFTLNGGSLTGSINGGAGTNSLTGSSATYNISGVNSGSITGLASGYTNIQNLKGSNGGNTFILNGGSISSISGGALSSTNTLQATNIANTWNITGGDSGDVNGFGFTGIGNLVGGSNDDTFNLTGSLSGSINGGAGTNSITNLTSNPVTWSITGANSGTATGMGSFSFSNIQNLTGGSGSDTLIGANVANVFNITGTNIGTLAGINFSGIKNLSGGSGNNNFVFFTGGSIENINGGTSPTTSINTLDWSNITTTINVVLGTAITNGTGPLITNGFTNINNLVANNGQADNHLTLPHNNKKNIVNITGPNPGPGTVTGYINDPTYFSGFNIITSASGLDTVVFSVPNSSLGSGVYSFNGTQLTFIGFNFSSPTTTSQTFNINSDIAQILQQGLLTENVTVYTNDVEENINAILREIEANYNIKINQLSINPYCIA